MNSMQDVRRGIASPWKQTSQRSIKILVVILIASLLLYRLTAPSTNPSESVES